MGVVLGDYDNDGFEDLYVTGNGGNRLYHNNCDGTFTDVTEKAGVAGEGWSTRCINERDTKNVRGDAARALRALPYGERVRRASESRRTRSPFDDVFAIVHGGYTDSRQNISAEFSAPATESGQTLRSHNWRRVCARV